MTIYNEFDAYPAQWLRNLIAAGHIAPGVVDERSITELRADELAGVVQFHAFAGIGIWSYALRLAGWPDDVPIWTVSCPCQPFSTAGRKGGFDDDRHLWPVWFELARQCLPPVIVGEQSASPAGLEWLDLVSTDLEGEGYAVGASDLPAASVGAPHKRQRLYFVAVADSYRASAPRVHVSGREPRREVPDARRNGTTDPVAHADDEGPQGRGLGRDGADERTTRTGGLARGVSDAEEVRRGSGRTSEARRRNEVEPDRHGADGRAMADPDNDGRRSHRPGAARGEAARVRSEAREQRLRPDAGPSGSPVSAWSDVEWLPCSDGKSRPTQPGIHPLAHGTPGRVGQLRAYGNGLCAPQAATFIRAVMEIL